MHDGYNSITTLSTTHLIAFESCMTTGTLTWLIPTPALSTLQRLYSMNVPGLTMRIVGWRIRSTSTKS